MTSKSSALILFSHGSKRATWSAPFEEIRDRLAMDGTLEVRLSFLEGLGPRLEEVTRELMKSKFKDILVFPVFLTASTHLQEDVPEAVENVRKQFNESDIRIHQINTKPLSHAIWSHTVKRAEVNGKSNEHTTVVLPYYGSDRYAKQWDDLLNKARTVLENAGFARVIHSAVGHIVGASPKPTQTAIEEGLKHTDFVTVVPMLLSPGIFQHKIIPEAIDGLSEEQKKKVTYVPDGILPDPNVVDWIRSCAHNFNPSK